MKRTISTSITLASLAAILLWSRPVRAQYAGSESGVVSDKRIDSRERSNTPAAAPEAALSNAEEQRIEEASEKLALLLLAGNPRFTDEFANYAAALRKESNGDVKHRRLMIDLESNAKEMVWLDLNSGAVTIDTWKIGSSNSMIAMNDVMKELQQGKLTEDQATNQMDKVIERLNEGALNVSLISREVYVADFNHRSAVVFKQKSFRARLVSDYDADGVRVPDSEKIRFENPITKLKRP